MSRKKIDPKDWSKHIYNTKDLTAFNVVASNAERKFNNVNQRLPWIEPSINMIHLDAVQAYIFGSPLASISTTVLLLEHSLRMALWDDEKSGILRKIVSQKSLKTTFGNLLSNNQKEVNKLIPDKNELEWWKNVNKAVRNKVAHMDLPAILRIAKELKLDEDYDYTRIEDPRSSHSWGMFWHRYGDKLASDFLKQSTIQVLKLINNTRKGNKNNE